ncbi:TPA: aspartate carbamoyltransferase regulatory subunit [Candidatus Marinimicrobia bacterium]|nr:MAG: Aspartate carbamoyltransferase regulatory chain [Marinimicrobia bacterium 46_47]KUK89505.1 MAG: aspartate carbamoyltransferase, regulatory subunit [Marinimicrobia bacterium 46_43]HAE86503.1 aspartate carbamoyltransferase regulatory subunit [Candidatus Neomarinimicrobiota bacterium]HBY18270.1 aspartate carbamoyltransferase regulatory subunit [Candidatus Neomarinimicrobiota bacterium]
MSDNKIQMIPKIRSGIVIDHIPAGDGVHILEILERDPALKNVPITFGMNYQSNKLGAKDMLKIQKDDLCERTIQHISLVSPGVTIKRIRNFEVVEKVFVQPPKEMVNLLRCLNPGCITQNEPGLKTRFILTDPKKNLVTCVYCEREFSIHELSPIV